MNALYHHGILGQKWGERNGPPYPLSASKHSLSEKKARWQKSLDKPKGTVHTKDDFDKYVVAGKAKVNAVLKQNMSGAAIDDENIAVGKRAVASIFGKKADEAEHGIKRLSAPESLEETLKNVNDHSGSGKNYKNNCTLCSIATFLRQQGLDVKSGSTGGKMQQLGEMVEECFKSAQVFEGSAVKFGRSRQDAAEMLVYKFGNNASGACSVQWKRGGGHAFNWKIKDGVVSFFDGQSGKTDDYCSEVYWKLMNPNGGLTLARLDDAEINYDGIKKLLE